MDDEFFEIDDEKDLDKENREFYDEAIEYGYTMVFNGYESDEEE